MIFKKLREKIMTKWLNNQANKFFVALAGGLVTWLASHGAHISPELAQPLGAFLTAVFVWLIPNKVTKIIGSALLVPLCALALLGPCTAKAQTPTLSSTPTFSWTAPTKNTDGTPFPASDIMQFTIYCDGAPVANPGATLTSYKLTTPLVSGSHSCTITVTSTAGVESAMSNAASFTVAPATPNAPTGFSAQ